MPEFLYSHEAHALVIKELRKRGCVVSTVRAYPKAQRVLDRLRASESLILPESVKGYVGEVLSAIGSGTEGQLVRASVGVCFSGPWSWMPSTKGEGEGSSGLYGWRIPPKTSHS